MSKPDTNPETELPQEGTSTVAETPAEGGASDFINELLETGTTVLTASTPDGLAELVNAIPADIRYMAGAVGRDPGTGIYSLRIDLIN